LTTLILLHACVVAARISNASSLWNVERRRLKKKMQMIQSMKSWTVESVVGQQRALAETQRPSILDTPIVL